MLIKIPCSGLNCSYIENIIDNVGCIYGEYIEDEYNNTTSHKINLDKVSHRITNLEINNNDLEINIEFVNTIYGDKLKEHIKNGEVLFIPRIIENKIISIDYYYNIILVRKLKINKIKDLIYNKKEYFK
jgi:actin-related protein